MPKHGRDIIVIGASAGGVQALQRLMGSLPPDLPAAIFVVLHLWPTGKSYLASILQRAGQLPVSEAIDGAPIRSANVYVAPTDFHLLVDDGRMRVIHGPRENRARPAINPLFRSAAASYRRRVVGVILTGTLDDGAAGLWAVKQCGGVTIVQSDAEFVEMPRSAVESVQVDHHLPLDEIGPLLNRLAREQITTTEEPPVPTVVRLNDEGSKMQPGGYNLDEIGRRSVLTCPECNGALWEVEEGNLQYRCHVGHAYSAGGLKEAQFINIEQTLWSALRALKESAALDERLAERSTQHNLDKAAEAHRRNAHDKMEQANQLQQFLSTLRSEGPAVPKT
jgi:two-component system, chemotaxis family, protein-glutamate methylesterase/glutaminase